MRAVLEAVREGKLSTEEALERLKVLPFEELGFATLDSHRSLRQGFPEVLFCPGKTIEQITAIAERLLHQHGSLLATRASEEVHGAIAKVDRSAEYNVLARTVLV
ncbi:MAG: nickel pincer cofactor biosynthesis protein LarB, partial [Candidatus Methylomirabilales bacterium]